MAYAHSEQRTVLDNCDTGNNVSDRAVVGAG